MIKPIIKENTMQAKTLILSTLALLLFACDSKEAPQKQKANNAQAATTPQNTATQQNPAAPSPAEFTPSANDISNLAKAMGGGAAGIMPDDAPKDKYGNPYIIGNLGGVPVNLPASVVEYVEYEDSPGFNPEALRNFKPSVRTYDSKIKSFGFYFSSEKGELLDRNNSEIMKIYNEQQFKSNYWIDVIISIFSSTPNYRWLDKQFSDYTSNQFKEKYPWLYFEAVPDKNMYGLESYMILGIDPKTEKPYRGNELSSDEDLFIAKDPEGHIITYITCSINRVPEPPCRHHFYFTGKMKINISLSYSKHLLSKWKEFENTTHKLINNFQFNSL